MGAKLAHGPRKKSLDFGGNPDHVTLGSGFGLQFGWSRVILCDTACVLPGVCLTVKIIHDQPLWRRCAL